ncbi:hypothetical protein AVEN_110172-1 [Araneus ventricosus]|uniref:Uncharacterized protein n=1 Tax=Araneus ventricosus TaxID=182803 RepID=A0A4Y2KWZ0_ARAVE|nr:hypothetical protein AVEN_110172-1 [Araneus ventricosus]
MEGRHDRGPRSHALSPPTPPLPLTGRLIMWLCAVHCRDSCLFSVRRCFYTVVMDVPVEEDTPFVLGVNEVDDEEKHALKIVISTNRPPRLVNKTEKVQKDTTDKLI